MRDRSGCGLKLLRADVWLVLPVVDGDDVVRAWWERVVVQAQVPANELGGDRVRRAASEVFLAQLLDPLDDPTSEDDGRPVIRLELRWDAGRLVAGSSDDPHGDRHVQVQVGDGLGVRAIAWPDRDRQLVRPDEISVDRAEPERIRSVGTSAIEDLGAFERASLIVHRSSLPVCGGCLWAITGSDGPRTRRPQASTGQPLCQGPGQWPSVECLLGPC